MLRCSARRLEALPPKVLVLSMNLQGGPLTPAMKALGYNPYSFSDVYRKGHMLTHPLEWKMILEKSKKFTIDILDTNAVTSSETGKKLTGKLEKGIPYDSLVGPPCTLAFESILSVCPRSTKVILVEEVNKLEWEKKTELELNSLLSHVKVGKWTKVGKTFYEAVELMFGIRRAVVSGARAHSGDHFYDKERLKAAVQMSSLGLAGSLDLFEDHVKNVVPRDRLLVYHVEEGWAPLCTFLGHEIPVDPATRDPIPFPTQAQNFEDLELLESGLNKTKMVATVGAVAIGALMIVLLAPFVLTFADVYEDMKQKTRSEEIEKFKEEVEADATNFSVRRLAILLKRSFIAYVEQLYEEGYGALFAKMANRFY
ncbi:hypothetical protein AGDE_05306 [Angomonas deanei]|nr:hypothetical protein AGDE_10889 [Angomonas deanei]EPY38623.1 hypothetical protein AGDE_05306 [Angomonas deanei]|eukprot:EPY27191.1 hypothetical protein AGDE_10889 [Angomonas deanei]